MKKNPYNFSRLRPLNDPFDGFEYHPCVNHGTHIAQAEEGETPDFWGVYVHLVEGGVDCIADVATEQEAKDLIELIKNLIPLYFQEYKKHEFINTGLAQDFPGLIENDLEIGKDFRIHQDGCYRIILNGGREAYLYRTESDRDHDFDLLKSEIQRLVDQEFGFVEKVTDHRMKMSPVYILVGTDSVNKYHANGMEFINPSDDTVITFDPSEYVSLDSFVDAITNELSVYMESLRLTKEEYQVYDSKRPKWIQPDLHVDSHHGVYSPQIALQQLRPDLLDQIRVKYSEEVDDVLAGPDNENYWDSWSTIVDEATFTVDGVELMFNSREDIWIMPVTNMGCPEMMNWD